MRYGAAIADMILEVGPVKPPEYKTYKVLRGDSLSLIAAKMLGNAGRWKEIWQINPQISNPDLIEVGQIINLPAEAVAVSSDPNKTLPSSGPIRTAVVTPEGKSFLSSPVFLIGLAGAGALLIILASRKQA